MAEDGSIAADQAARIVGHLQESDQIGKLGAGCGIEHRGPRDRHEDQPDVLLADRYVASNAAYGAARLHQGADGEFVEWVRQLEIERFGMLVPHAHLLLRVPVDVAASRAEHRERTQTDRARDAFESDGGLQARCARVYDRLAAADWLSPWHVLDGTSRQDAAVLAKTLLR